MLKWRHSLSASTHLISFPFYSLHDIETRIYNLKCVFHYEPREDTPFVNILYDTAMIDKDFKKAKEERQKAEMKNKVVQSMVNSRNKAATNAAMRRRR